MTSRSAGVNSLRSGGDAIFELFNVFNYANYNAFVTNEASRTCGASSLDSDITFQAGTMQFGFRTTVKATSPHALGDRDEN